MVPGFHQTHGDICCVFSDSNTNQFLERTAVLFKFSGADAFVFCVFQWLVGNIVQRDDALYPRMKQRDLGGHDTMWEPMFMDDAAMGLGGLGDQKNKVPKGLCYAVGQIQTLPYNQGSP